MKQEINKLINDIDSKKDFSSISNKIDYDKYTSKKRFKLSPSHIFAGIALAFATFLVVDHFVTYAQNQEIKNYFSTIYDLNNTKMVKISNKADYNQKVAKTTMYNESILDKMANIFDAGVIKDYAPQAPLPSVENMLPSGAVSAPTADNPENSQINTNVQTQGIDEADVSKCDGQYIYCVFDNNFTIYNLQGNKIVDESLAINYSEMYVVEDKVILLADTRTSIYSFDGNDVDLLKTFTYGQYNTSRVYQNQLLLIVNEQVDVNDEDTYENLYYDGCSQVNRVYSIYKYDLKRESFDVVKNLNSGQTKLYTSTNKIYLATTVRKQNIVEDEYYSSMTQQQLTVISIFDYSLNALGAIRVQGSILNQFSMDEYDNHLRVVTTNSFAYEPGRLNALSVYDLDDLSLVGYLDKDIGIDFQTVRSVRFENETCYVVTYQNSDPLYEIDISDVTEPKIVSVYKSPGYSNYLHTFEIDGETYLFGIGYLDDISTRKISVYKNDEYTSQIGEDFTIGYGYYEPCDIVVDDMNYSAFDNHKALFVYNDEENLYLGFKVTNHDYYIFKIDVDASEVVSIYKKVSFDKGFANSRCYLIDGTIYITTFDDLYIEKF